MRQNVPFRASAATFAILAVIALTWPTQIGAQSVSGQARAVQATVNNATTILADTGTLADANDARDATGATGAIPSVLSAETLHAVTVGLSDRAVSEVSLTNLGVRVGVTDIAADVVMARALAAAGAMPTGSALIGNLSINGVPVMVTGSPNQTIPIPGGQVVVNEQRVSSRGATVNALHATVFGVADVVIASATAGMQ